MLSGDINVQGEKNDNSYHVVKGADGAVLDGFTITLGNANGSGSNRNGGGIYCDGVSLMSPLSRSLATIVLAVELPIPARLQSWA